MLQLWLREVLLFLDAVSFNTCNRNEKMQESQTREGRSDYSLQRIY